MGTAADSNAYGGGAGGKFRKRPFRRPQPTPYDRPLTALRNTWRNNDNGGRAGGWLSRIVDPASKLIAASANKLFSSVFRKRLLPPPLQPPSDEKVDPSENHLGDVITEDPSRIQERDKNEGNAQNNGSVTGGVAELEHILQQKTFTRSEIDRLTVLLHSRTADRTGIAGQSRFESSPFEPPAGESRREELDVTACENGVSPSEVPGADFTPAIRSKVNDDVALPAALGKAYMGSRATRASPSMSGPPRHTAREETHTSTTFLLHGPSVPTVQKPLSTAGTRNDFVIPFPRSRGRSAIYSMARTPYSRVLPTATKGLGTSNNAFDQQSSSSQKVLKRRSSVLENDIGAVGSIRRIRQKSNLHYSKTLALPSSHSSLTNETPSEVGEASLYSSSKSQEDRGGKVIPVSSSHISSKSMEMGQRILQQLEQMTPPKEKSSEKKPGFSTGMSTMELTPAMLHGQARKSLETVNSLKYLQSDQLAGKEVDSLDVALHEVRDSTSKEQDMICENSGKVSMNSSNKVHFGNNEARITDNDVVGVAKNSTPVVLKSTVNVPKKSQAFQMSAYEDYLELDDDIHSNGVASPLVYEDKRNLELSSLHSNGKMLQETHPLPEATKADAYPAVPELKSSSNQMLKKDTAAESSTSAAPPLQPLTTSISVKADIPASTFSFGLKSSDRVSPASFFSSAVESSIPKDVKSERPGSVYAFGAGATDAAIKSPEPNNKGNEAVDMFKKSDNTSVSTASTVSFGMPANASTGSISSLGSVPVTSSAQSPFLFPSQHSSSDTAAQSTFTASTNDTGVSARKVGGDAADTATATVNSSGNGVMRSVAFPSFEPAHTFGGSPVASDSIVMADSRIDAVVKSNDTVFGNSISSSLPGAASSATPSSSIVSFKFGASTLSTNSQLPSSTASVSITESMPSQPGGSVLPASVTSVSAPFGSSSSGSCSVAASGSTSSASTNIFGGSWQPNSSPVFGSASSNSSSGPSFGASSSSTPLSSASSGFAFGTASVSAPANGSPAVVPFGASSTSAAASSISPSSGSSFGASSSTPTSSVSPGNAFGTSISAPANGSTAGVPFGASPTAAAGSTSSVFALGSSSSASSTPSSSLSFGVSPASASSSAPSSTLSFGASSASGSSSTPSSTFAFGASSASASSSAASATFSFGASSASASSSAPSSTFSFGAPSASASSSTPSSTFSFGTPSASSAAPSSPFSFGAPSASASSAAPSSPFSFGAPSASASSGTPSSTFSFGAASSSASSSAPSSTFSFGASSASAGAASPASIFPFGSAASAPVSTTLQPSQPTFGNVSSVFAFGSAPSPSPLSLGNNDQMSMEDSMAEDSTQSPAVTATPLVFGQNPPSNFGFGMAASSPSPAGANPFQFGSQPSQVAAASQNPFQNSGSFDGGSFSLGAGGGNDKSNRRIVKVRSRNRKK